MLFRSGSSLVLAIATGGTLLVAGCLSRPATNSSSSNSPAAVSGSADSDSEDELIEAHAHYATALIHEMNGEGDAALSEFYEAAIHELDNETLVLDVSRRLLQAKQPEKALELVSRAAARPKVSAKVLARLGYIYFQLGKQDLAIASNRTAIKRDPRSLIGYQNLFLIHLQNRRPQEALAILDEAAKVSQTDPDFLVGLGELYGNFALQNPSQRDIAATRGIAVLRRAAKVKISEVQLRLRLADAFNAVNEDGEAARIYQEVLKQSPDSPFLREGVRAQLADIYLRGSDHAKAAEQLQNLIQDNPTDAKAYYFLGTLAYNETNYTQAIESFSKVILLNPEFEQAYYDLASAQISADKSVDALVTLEKTRQKFPQKFFPEYLTGLAYSHQKDYTNALVHFTSAEVIAQATDPRQLKDTFFFQIGATFERKGDYEQAEKYFEKCLELSPNLSEAQNYLGYMLADRGVKLDRARELIDRALKAEPKNSAYLDSMGWVLFKQNKPKEALDYILDAVKNSEEEDAELYNHLGEIYAVLHQADKARDAWTKSIALEPNEGIRRKLEQLAK